MRADAIRRLLLYSLSLFVVACSSVPPMPQRAGLDESGREIVLYALGLIDTDYRFGGKNPQAGLDCSGMVSYIYQQAAGVRLSGSAADMARKGRPISRTGLRPGDLVFFNTGRQDFSHVGIYIGEDRFVHAPASNGRIRVDQLDARYYAQRFAAARRYFD